MIENNVVHIKDFYKDVDTDKLRDILLDLCKDNELISKEIEYYRERYKPDACKDKLKELYQKSYANTSLMVLLSDLLDDIQRVQKGIASNEFAVPNSNYGEKSPIPLSKSERSF